VIAMLECPTRDDVTLRSAPDSSISDAWVCRSPWKRDIEAGLIPRSFDIREPIEGDVRDVGSFVGGVYKRSRDRSHRTSRG